MDEAKDDERLSVEEAKTLYQSLKTNYPPLFCPQMIFTEEGIRFPLTFPFFLGNFMPFLKGSRKIKPFRYGG